MIHLPLGIPCADLLCSEGQAVETYEPSAFPLGKVEGLRVLFLNLMPVKQDAEIDTARVLSFADEDVWLLPIRIAGQTYKNTPLAHMERFYRTFDEVASSQFDGLIINGAPLELLPFEQVRYWPQLCEIMDWAVSHIRASLFVCWGAFAALYHYYGIPKYIFEKKRLGIFSHKVVSLCPLTEGLPQAFPVPTSRYSELCAKDFRVHEKDGLQIVAQCEESGVGIAFDAPHRRAFNVGHLEYAADTLDREFHRDIAKGLPIQMPANYYVDDDPARGFRFEWQSVGKQFYRNWLRLCRA